MARKKRNGPLQLGDHARNKLNGRVGTVDAVEQDGRRVQYGLHYNEEPQDHFLLMPERGGASLPAELVERE